jgi:hypothetical protein
MYLVTRLRAFVVNGKVSAGVQSSTVNGRLALTRQCVHIEDDIQTVHPTPVQSPLQMRDLRSSNVRLISSYVPDPIRNGDSNGV